MKSDIEKLKIQIPPGGVEILNGLYEEEMDRVFSFSGNYLMSIPKKGYEKEFELHNARAEVLKALINSFLDKEDVKC